MMPLNEKSYTDTFYTIDTSAIVIKGEEWVRWEDRNKPTFGNDWLVNTGFYIAVDTVWLTIDGAVAGYIDENRKLVVIE